MYSLARICYIVQKTDDTTVRKNVFMSVVQNSKTIRYCYKLYLCSPKPIQALLILLYGLKCFLSLAWPKTENAELAYIAAHPNERLVLQNIQSIFGESASVDISISLRNCTKHASLLELPAFIFLSRRLYQFARKLVSRYEFMPACRIFSAVAYYIRLRPALVDRPVKGVFIASQYSPESLALAAAAHNAAKKVLFTNHANATGECSFVAPIHADLVAVTSQALADLYRKHTSTKLNIVHIPIVTPQAELQIPQSEEKNLTVGIYLTALTSESRLRNLIDIFSPHSEVGSVFVRTHPARVVNLDLSDISSDFPSVTISNLPPLKDHIRQTDIAICGNSTVAIEILRLGRPVLYDPSLDTLPYDYCGYMKHDLMPLCPQDVGYDVFSIVNSHYEHDNWISRMQYFDASYGSSQRKMIERFKKAVKSLLTGNESESV